MTRPQGYREPTDEEMKCLPEGTLADYGTEWCPSCDVGHHASLTSAEYAVPNTDVITRATEELKHMSSDDPKQQHGEKKPQLHLIPPAANEEMAAALSLGARKYGQRNWLQNKVAICTYLAAMKRHIDCLLDGEDMDQESGAHHLGHVMAGCAIVLDAKRHGMLVDDRILPSSPCP